MPAKGKETRVEGHIIARDHTCRPSHHKQKGTTERSSCGFANDGANKRASERCYISQLGVCVGVVHRGSTAVDVSCGIAALPLGGWCCLPTEIRAKRTAAETRLYET
jgi:hypothetical protein